jgi:Ca-activated chloride channel homolog
MKVELKLAHPRPVPGRPLAVQALLQIEGEAPDTVHRLPINVALVLDRSGSMHGEKLRNARKAAKLLVRRLSSDDRVSVVGYDDQVLTLASGLRGGRGDGEACRAIDRLEPRGLTNLSGGWFRGRDLAEEHRIPHGVNRILLMTDGLANQGITHRGALEELCRDAAREGITTTTIGFGADFDEDLLHGMAEAGDGRSWYVEHPNQAEGIFEEEIHGLLNLAARGVHVRLRTGGAARFRTLRHDYPVTHVPGGVDIAVGELYASEPRLVLLEFELREWHPGQEIELGTIEVVGAVLTSGGFPGEELDERVIRIPVRLVVGERARVDAEIRRTAVLLDAARGRREAARRYERGDFSGAMDSLSVAYEAFPAAGLDDALSMREASDLERLVGKAEACRELSPMDLKYLKQSALDEGRSNRRAKDRYYRK